MSVDYATPMAPQRPGATTRATSGTLTWLQGDASDKSIAIPISDDAAQEAGEQFGIELSNLVGATLDGSAQFNVTISANDGASSGGGGGGGGGGIDLAWLLMALSVLGRGLYRRAA